MTLRDATETDYPLLAVLHNATHEPHFHVSTADLASRDVRPSEQIRGRLVATVDGEPVGMASYAVQDFDRNDRVWLDLAIHPDRLRDDIVHGLVDAVIDRSRHADATSLWMPVREDYLGSWPEPIALGFHEIHRTFGGGFFLTDARDYTRRDATSTTTRLQSVDTLDLTDDHYVAQLRELYAVVQSDKVTAAPTITAAAEQLDIDDIIAPASFVALDHGQCIGLCLAAPSALGAWLSVVAVHPEHRGRGIARSMLAATLTELRNRQIAFLNTAGVGSDDAYLNLLRSLGATIEPDWISFERQIPV